MNRIAGAPISWGGSPIMSGPIGIGARPARPVAGVPMGMRSYRKGGKVKKTGPAWLHKGELVVPLNKLKSR